MTMGNKLSEEQTDEIIKEFNPKGDKTFEYPPIVSKLMKRWTFFKNLKILNKIIHRKIYNF